MVFIDNFFKESSALLIFKRMLHNLIVKIVFHWLNIFFHSSKDQSIKKIKQVAINAGEGGSIS